VFYQVGNWHNEAFQEFEEEEKNHSSLGAPICPVFGLVSRICPDVDKPVLFHRTNTILTCF